MRAIITLALFLLIAAAQAYEAPRKILSEKFADIPALEHRLKSSAEHRADLLGWAWVMASRNSSVENRAYFYALTVHLYNSLPPDMESPPLQYEEGVDVYEPDTWPIKAQWASNLAVLSPKWPRNEMEERAKWEDWRTNLDPNVFKQAVEKSYIEHYLRQEMKSGHLALDAPSEPASVESTELNILNPPQYLELERFLESARPAMLAGIPPWRVETFRGIGQEQGQGQGHKQQSLFSSEIPPVAQGRENGPSEEGVGHRWWIGGVIFIVLLIIAFMVRTGRR